MLALLREIINPEVQLEHADKKLIFLEDSDDARLKQLEFKLTNFITASGGQLKNAVIISSDIKGELFARFSHFLAEKCPDINKKCDYIIFHRKENVLRVILCEMKSSEKGVGGRCPAQLEVSKVFADYLLNLAKTYGDLSEVDDIAQLQTEYFKVVFLPTQSVPYGQVMGVKPTDIKKGANPLLQVKKRWPNGITSFSVNTIAATAKVDWRHFMEALDL